MLVFVLIFVFTAAVYWYYLRRYDRYNKNIKCIRGPPTLPFVGNALDFKSWGDFMEKSKDYYKKYGPIFKIRIGPVYPTIMVCDSKFIGMILSSPKMTKKGIDYVLLKDWLGDGLLTSDPSQWKVHRKMITPAFHFKILEDFVDVFSSIGDILVNKLKQEVGKDSFDIYPYFNLCVLDGICESAMGVAIHAQTSEDSEYVSNVKKICEFFAFRSISIIYIFFKFLYPLTSTYKDEKKSLKQLHCFTNDIIKKRRNELKEKREKEAACDEHGIKRRKAFLDLLLEASDSEGLSFSDEEIRYQVDTIMFGGHDTVSSALSFAAYCLAKNLQVQKRAYEEIRSVFDDDKNRNITHRDLQDLPYLEMVIKEVMRLYPPAPHFSREIEEDVEYGGVTYPKGTELCIDAYLVHRDPNIFPDPEMFDPERFANPGDIPLYSYIPFSAGPRNCIGQKYAMLEMKALLSRLLLNYEILPSVPEHHLDLDVQIVLKSSNGVRVRIQQRSR